MEEDHGFELPRAVAEVVDKVLKDRRVWGESGEVRNFVGARGARCMGARGVFAHTWKLSPSDPSVILLPLP